MGTLAPLSERTNTCVNAAAYIEIFLMLGSELSISIFTGPQYQTLFIPRGAFDGHDHPPFSY
jgi:hypothetical protein